MINVAYVFDENFTVPALVSILSAIDTNKNENLCFHLITYQENSEYLKAINDEIIAKNHYVKNYLVDGNHFLSWVPGSVMQYRNSAIENAPFSNAAYLKLLLPSLIGEDKVIFLDSDTLVGKCLADLYNWDLRDYVVGGVFSDGMDIFLNGEDIFGYKSSEYLNTGVLLMDLKKLRQIDFLNKCKKAYNKFASRLKFADQDIINLVLTSQKTVLPERFNVFMKFSDDQHTIEKKINKLENSILHFVGDVKPWQSWNLPRFCEIWEKFARLAGKENIRLTPITNLSQIIKHGQLLHSYGDYRNASLVKSKAISVLLKEMHK